MDKDPWDRSKHDEPPGLDEIFDNVVGSNGGPAKVLVPFLIVILIMFVASGFFIVSPAEKGVVTRFGKLYRIAEPGPNWIIPIVDRRFIVNVHAINTYNYNAEMLTSDESYANVDVTVFYRIQTPEAFLFNAVDPVDALGQATASALRQVVGNTTLEEILTDGRIKAREEINLQIIKIVESYDLGIEVTDTKLQDARHPAAVKAAYDDVIQAREDYDRYIMDAEAYRNNVVPKAEGQKKRIENQAKAEHEKILMEAQGEVAGFLAIVPEFKRSPKIISDRLFYSTMKDIYGNVKKVFVENDKSLNVLPLNEVLNGASNRGGRS